MAETPEQMQQKAEEIGKQFVQFYYSVFDENRAQLAPLYVCFFATSRSSGK